MGAVADRADVFQELREQKGTLLELPLEQVQPAPDNPRREFGDLAELTQTIVQMGVLQPLVVTPTLAADRYLIVAGHRRFAAAALAGLTTIPAIVRPMTDEERLQAMLVENVQREDVKPLEEAAAYRRLVDEFGLTQRELATKVGRTQGHISKRLALLEIPAAAAAALDSGGIDLQGALELARLRDDPKRQLRAWKQRGQVYGGLVAAVEEELERKQREELIAAEEAKLKERGLRVVRYSVPANRWQEPELPKGTLRISKGGGWNELLLDPAQHAKEPCHAAAVRIHPATGKAEVVYVCTDRKRHPKAKTDSERGRSSSHASSYNAAARELEKARVGRRAHAGIVARGRVGRGGLSKDEHGELVLDALVRSAHSEVLKIACRMLDLAADGGSFRDFGATLRKHAAASASNRQQVELAIAFATHEEFMSGPYNGWTEHADYVRLLERHGYALTEAERKKPPKPKRPKGPA